MPRIPTTYIPRVADARRLADPRKAAAQARENPAPTILLIFAVLVAIQVYKAQRLPTVQQFATYVAAAVAFVLMATVAPDFVTWTLLLVALYVFLTNAALVEDAVARFTGSLPSVAQIGRIAS